MWNKKEMSQLDATLTRVPLTFSPWHLTLNFEGQIVSREWEARLSWNERDRSRWDALMWNTKEMSQLDAALTGVPWPLTLNFESQIVSREWEAWLPWNERDGFDKMPWCETQPLGDLETEDTVRDRGDLRCWRFRRLVEFDPNFPFEYFMQATAYEASTYTMTPNLAEAEWPQSLRTVIFSWPGYRLVLLFVSINGTEFSYLLHKQAWHES